MTSIVPHLPYLNNLIKTNQMRELHAYMRRHALSPHTLTALSHCNTLSSICYVLHQSDIPMTLEQHHTMCKWCIRTNRPGILAILFGKMETTECAALALQLLKPAVQSQYNDCCDILFRHIPISLTNRMELAMLGLEQDYLHIVRHICTESTLTESEFDILYQYSVRENKTECRRFLINWRLRSLDQMLSLLTQYEQYSDIRHIFQEVQAIRSQVIEEVADPNRLHDL